MKKIINIGVDPTNSFELNKHIKIINTFALFGGVVSIVFAFITIPYHFFTYSTSCFVSTILMGIILFLNRIRKYQTAKTFLLLIVPCIIFTFYLLFGPIGIEYYLISEIVFLFFLFKKDTGRILVFILLAISFIGIRFISLNDYISPSLPISELLVFINITISFILTFIGLNLFYQEHVINQSLIEKHNLTLVRKNREIEGQNIIKDKLFSLVSHDLRGPLNSLNALIDMLSKDYISLDQMREQLPGLSEKLNNTSNLVENLLTWTKTQLKGLRVHPEKIDLVGIFNEIIQLFEENLKKKSIVIDFKLSANTSLISDKEMLKTIIRNILHNGIKFSNSNSKIYICTEDSPEKYFITIQDEGTGMDPHIVEKFNNNEDLISAEGTSGEKGTGLGLLIVKELSEQLNAKVSIKSAKSEGTTFQLALPHEI